MDIHIANSSALVPNRAELARVQPITSVADAELQHDFGVSAIMLPTEQDAVGNELEPSQLNQVVAELSDMMSMMRKGLAFKVNESSGQAVVTVLDRDTGDVIRQMPSEEALKLAEKLSEVTGLLMKTEA